ncbi:hypothetical protein Q3G72_024383 [Acer saccharum]|nr:hypothetical protein Q3G72_024383 [Acer saccharum]
MDSSKAPVEPEPVLEVGQATAAPLAKITSRLNPSAKEWDLWVEQTPVEKRGLFLTFSNGFPLNENQIRSFFTNNYGPYVERVYVHRPEPMIHRPPLFGKIVFKVSSIPISVLNGEEQTKFMVDGKPLWCKKFRPL